METLRPISAHKRVSATKVVGVEGGSTGFLFSSEAGKRNREEVVPPLDVHLLPEQPLPRGEKCT